MQYLFQVMKLKKMNIVQLIDFLISSEEWQRKTSY